MTIHQILHRYWGYKEFRPLQEDIIHSALSRKDTLALLPTGSGKSMCFQVPALAMDGVCLVISPLIALMKDQVIQLQKKGISALALHTGMSYKEVMKTMELAVNEKIRLLYVSPERLQTKLFKEFLPELSISLLAIDEAHCVSQWGYDFRPSYLQIATLREWIPDVPVLALTASATPMVQEDIIQQLKLRNPAVIKGSFAREALSYSCFEEDNKIQKLVQILQQVPGSSIVYCKSRKRTVDVCRQLQEKGFKATYYHAGLDQEDRHARQQEWTSNQARIMVSTNAFGMGIDKPDVRTVIHFDVPDCLENYYQEAGRAGRDRQKAYAVLLYNQQELDELKLQVGKKFPDQELVRKVYQNLANFLHIPTGTGAGNTYDFDLALFCNNFNIDRPTAINALQILQAEGYCALNESVFAPSKVQFISNRQWLENFEQQYPNLEPLIKALLRNYEGLFTYPANISEQFMGKILRKEKQEIIENLQSLHRYGILSYEHYKDNPQLLLLAERVKAEYVLVNTKAIQKRRELARKRLSALEEFIKGHQCRSVFIGNYFGDTTMKACGICDKCLQLKKSPVTVSTISKDVFTIIQSAPNSMEGIKDRLPYSYDEKDLQKAIEFLLSEERIRVHINGIYSSN